MTADLERLIDQITETIWERLSGDGAGSPGACSRHDLACALNAGASRIGLPWGEAATAAGEIAPYIDHTLLRPDATQDQIDLLCQEALTHQFASVCVNPFWVRHCATLLYGSPVKVCTVIGFPLGATLPDVKAYETRRAIFDGATEIDMVLNVGALKSGDEGGVCRDLQAVVQAAREGCALVKVILETALLTDEEKIRACQFARDAGADFVKTSTGFSQGGATVADIELMRRVVGDQLGVKASGGVRDLAGARQLIAAGASRIGASAGVRIVQESHREGNLLPQTSPLQPLSAATTY
jgi:deoxyribose-phosphate aldolase